MKANNIYLKISQRGYKLDLNRHLNSLSKNILKNHYDQEKTTKRKKKKKMIKEDERSTLMKPTCLVKGH